MKITLKTKMLPLTLSVMTLCGALLLATSGVNAAAVQSRDNHSLEQPATTVTTVSADGDSVSVSLVEPGKPGHVPSRVIVRFREGSSFLPGSGRSVMLSRQRNVHRVDNPPGLSVAQVVARYQANPNVLYAEPDYILNTLETSPNDPLYGSQWDMAKIAAPAAWDLHTDSNGTVVAVVDTGIDYSHPDLAANLYSDASDPKIHGYTCLDGSCVPGGLDDHGHGTHVAGTIGAVTNNSTGVAGINWHVQLLAIKFLDSAGSGATSDAVLGFEKLLELKKAGVNIRVTNNSWGGGGYSQALKDAMAALETTAGYSSTLNVCAAGNSNLNTDFSPMYPAAYDNRGIVSVLATDSNDAGASFTNYGLASVDIAAPGVNIFSTEAMGTCSLCDATGYRSLSGTSMASPHVAGVAAALLNTYKERYPTLPDLTAAQARDALLHPGSYDWMDNAKAQSTSSGGRLNFYKTLSNFVFLENPVLNQFPTVTKGPDVFTTEGGAVDFQQSASDPDDPADTLRLQTGRGPVSSASAWLFGWHLSRLFPSALPFTAPSLARTAAMSYDTSIADNRGGGASVRNWAVVQKGSSPGSAPVGVLTVPETGTVGVPVTIGFTATDPDSDAVAWDLMAATLGGSSGNCCFTGSSATKTFTKAGNYRILVQAMDSRLNTSETYTKEIAISGTDGIQPTNGHVPIAVATVSPESGPAPLTVNVDLSGSSDLDGTIVTYFNSCDGSTAGGTSNPRSTCTFEYPGTYWLQFFVKDNTGNLSPAYKYVVVHPAPGGAPDAPEVPAAPTNLTASTLSTSQINPTWTDSSSNEDGFKIERSPDGSTWTQIALVATNTQTYSDIDLQPGTTYHYRVRATSAVGDSAYSNLASATTQAAPAAMHIGGLSGAASPGAKTWAATVTVTVHDTAHKGVSGATVSGLWSGAARGSGTCTTGDNGTCVLIKDGLNNNKTSITLAVTGVSKTGSTYQAAENEATSITVTK